MEDWTKQLTDDQKCLMRALSGLITDASEIMDVMTRNMDERLNTLVRLGYIETLAKALNINTKEEENDRN